MNSAGKCFKVQFSLSGLWHGMLQLFTLLLLLGCVQAAFATPTTPTSDFIDNADGTVTHMTTGLTWMRCALGQTWTGSACTGTAKTYTYAAAKKLGSSFAGHSDWRLPNIAELQTIVERNAISPAINTELFPNTPNDAFWSSSPNVGNSYLAWDVYFASPNVGSSYLAWGVYFGNGNVSNTDWYNAFGVRLVRASQSLVIGLSTPSTEFTDHHDGTVTHKRTGLMWQRCSLGQTWTGSSCSGKIKRYRYNAAQKLTSSLAGHNDWRVPTANELASIVSYDKSSPSINTEIFHNTPSEAFWSSSPNIGYANSAWYVVFDLGYVYNYGRGDGLAVRLVRASQSFQTGDNDKFQETGNGATAADNAPFKSKITTTLETRGEIAYLPNDPLPFTGVFQKFYENGQKQGELNYKDGKQNGLATIWYENGQKQAEVNYKDGKANGLTTSWYENGQKRAEENYKDDKINGLTTSWYESGQKQAEKNYKDGKKNGLATIWDENGQKKAEVNYKDGKVNGLATSWYENGQKEEEVNYKDGKKNGLATIWDENGQKQAEVNFKNGKVIEPEKSSVEDNSRTLCSTIALLAEQTMTARQAGTAMIKLMEANQTNEPLAYELAENMIIAAYEIDRYGSVELQQKTIEEFRNKAYLMCLKAHKP